ncbi:unnamed protein product [Prunus armeniaca]|uniref:Uncharacterized protein n=1 Tax=Prunus armeniaca TaxID=36596 RepID=A0A6J5X7F4_PRUAR|nr:unnamed protein product [Prunus armeniaca]
MAFSSCLCQSPLSPKIDCGKKIVRPWSSDGRKQRFTFSLGSNSRELVGQQLVTVGAHLHKHWSFVGGSRVTVRPELERSIPLRKSSGVYAAWLSTSQIASTAFTLGTTAVLPFYTLMVLAPKAELLIFASKYWLPELPGMVRMFSNEMTLASAWIHLLAVDLFAARFFAMDRKTKLRPGIQFLFASFSAPLELLLMSLPKH